MKSLPRSNRTRCTNRRGLTLIELLLVLVILIGLAAVLVPMFGNVVGLTHAASSSASIESTARAIENHKAMFGGYPNQLDLLLTDHADDSTLAPFGGTVAATELTTVAVTDRIADALGDAGIIEVVENPADAALLDEEDHTIFGLGDTAGGTERVIAVSDTPSPTNVVVLGADAIVRLGLDPTFTYVVLGVGNNNDGIGKSMVSAPVHFLPDGGSNEAIYSRFLAVFRISAAEGPAILSSVVTVDVHHGAGEVIGLDGHIREYNHAREQ